MSKIKSTLTLMILCSLSGCSNDDFFNETEKSDPEVISTQAEINKGQDILPKDTISIPDSTKSKALQTRSQFAINSLSLASQAAQSVLKLF